MLLTAPDCRRDGAQEPWGRGYDRNSLLAVAGPLNPGEPTAGLMEQAGIRGVFRRDLKLRF